MHIIISGGGIGGLCAALCLARTGHQITILEQAPAFAEVGAGLQISPNGMKVLRTLGLEEAARTASFEPEQIEMRFGQSGQTIFDIPLKGYAERRWGAPFLQFHRADLLGVLLDAVMASPDIALKPSSKVTAYQSDADGISVALEGQPDLTADLLIGADGIHSMIREQMLGPEAPEFTGCMAWRGVVDVDKLAKTDIPPTACAWVGRGKHAVTYKLRGGKLVNFVGVVEQSEFRQESWSTRGTREQIARDFGDWHPVIQEIIEQGDDFFRWGLFGRPVLPRWHDPRVALLGDAAHPMLPFLAQGAVMAMEDGWVLASALALESRSLAERLALYQTERLDRTAKVQARSRRNRKIFHLSNPLMRGGVYGAMRIGSQMTPEIVHRQMDWIYRHDVVSKDYGR